MKTIAKVIWLSCLWPAISPAAAQHTVVLRNLSVIRDAQIDHYDWDGVRLQDEEGSRLILWCDIRQIDNGGDEQAVIEQRIAEIGLPWFRIRQRIENGDFGNLQQPAEQLRKQVENQQNLANYFACAAQVHAAINTNNRIAAVEPLLHMIHLRRSITSKIDEFAADIGLKFDVSGICLNLLPVWFESNQEEFEKIVTLVEQRPQDFTDDPASSIYLASLHIAHGNASSQVEIAISHASWQAILAAQSSLFDNRPQDTMQILNSEEFKIGSASEAIALYYEGLARRKLAPANPETEPDSQWAVTLLRIPADFGDRFPELSAAAIYHVLQSLQDEPAGRQSLAHQLNETYRYTYFGRRFRSEPKQPMRQGQ